MKSKKELVEHLSTVLSDNWSGTYTRPAAHLYPHQWLWDSCFTAIGLRHIDVVKAQQELRSLIRGQWSNGMLPHMIFNDKHQSFTKDSNIWQSKRNPYAPDDIATSGITQPPLLAEAVVKVGEKLPLRERRSWYQDMYPAIVRYHEWLYAERDPHGDGLVVLIHPWESGLDNSPPWIEQLHRHAKPWWVRIVEKLRLDSFVRFLRRDTHYVPPGQRLRDIDALLYHSVMLRLRRKNWMTENIMDRSHFLVEDLAYNSIFVRANQHLAEIAKAIGHELPEELIDNIATTENSLENLWDSYYMQYFSRHFITRKFLKQPTIATLLPLYSGSVTKERAEQLVAMLKNKDLFHSTYPISSVPLNSGYFKEHGYWQGPTWVNTNWMVADGLERYGFTDEARHIKEQSLRAVEAHGPWEYFSPKDGTPAGAENFSWTAALIIDFIS